MSSRCPSARARERSFRFDGSVLVVVVPTFFVGCCLEGGGCILSYRSVYTTPCSATECIFSSVASFAARLTSWLAARLKFGRRAVGAVDDFRSGIAERSDIGNQIRAYPPPTLALDGDFFGQGVWL